MKPVIIGLDIGGTNIKSILIDISAPAILDKKQISTQASSGIATVIDNIIRLINGNISYGQPPGLSGIGRRDRFCRIGGKRNWSAIRPICPAGKNRFPCINWSRLD